MHSFQELSPALLVDETGRHSPQWVGLGFSSLAWEGGAGAIPGYSQFSKQTAWLGGVESYRRC